MRRTSPQSSMTTSTVGRSWLPLATFSIMRTMSMPSRTLPNTTWRPSSHEVIAVVMKNCEPVRGISIIVVTTSNGGFQGAKPELGCLSVCIVHLHP
jgi:hypothetical protein